MTVLFSSKVIDLLIPAPVPMMCNPSFVTRVLKSRLFGIQIVKNSLQLKDRKIKFKGINLYFIF